MSSSFDVMKECLRRFDREIRCLVKILILPYLRVEIANSSFRKGRPLIEVRPIQICVADLSFLPSFGKALLLSHLSILSNEYKNGILFP